MSSVVENTNYNGKLLLNDFKDAEMCIIEMVQVEYFAVEIQLLRRVERCKDLAGMKLRKAVLKQSSSVYELDPFLDQDGIIRVGGRLKRSSLDNDSMHPILLPKGGGIPGFTMS